MRPAIALGAAMAIVQGCSRIEDDRSAILLAGLEELGKEFKDPRIPLCATLSERQPLARRSWAFIQGDPPSGFADVAGAPPVTGALSLEPLRRRLPRRWFIEEGAGELCFQLTRPAIRDSRAVVTGAFGGDGETLSGTWNFWLRREGGQWRVVATTKGHHDV